MKKQLLELIICPHCLPLEYSLIANIIQEADGDIETGALHCPHCTAQFPITEGVALLDPYSADSQQPTNKYETTEVVASYLWSHYGELLDDAHASQAPSMQAERWAASPLR
jgi:uncharacterized protein YbaR (Trm112 family)